MSTIPSFAVSAEPTQNNAVMVVTANGYQKKITDSPASISVISQQDLQTKNYMNLGEALSGIEGVDVRSDTGKTGNLSVSIRGMPSNYTLILIDGVRQSASTDTTPNGFGSMSSAMMPPMSAIDHIEVIRGPMSTLYGSDAIGGVVNIITKKNTDRWHGSFNVGHDIQEHDRWGDTSNVSFYTSGPVIKDKLNVVLRGQVKHRQGSSITSLNSSGSATRSPYPTESGNYTLGGKLSYNTHSWNTIWIDGHVARQKYDNDKDQLGPVGTSGGGYEDTLRYEENQLIVGHDTDLSIGDWHSDLSYTTTQTKGRLLTSQSIGPAYASAVGDKRELKNINTILNTKLVSNVGHGHVTTMGGQYWDARMKDGIVLTTTGETFKQKSYSLFGEDDWQIIDPLDLTVGLRYEHHDSFGGHFSPRAYLVWHALDDWTVKGGVSTGYRTPSLSNLHDGVSGITGNGTVSTIGNPDLDPEESTNYELGIYYQNDADFNANITFFVNRYKNAISSISVDSSTNTYVNIGKARVEGIELATAFPLFTPALNLSLNYTYTRSQQIGGDNNGAPLRSTARNMANAKLNWQVNEKFNSWLQAEYHGKTPRYTSNYRNLTSVQKQIMDEKGNLKDWTVINLGASYHLTEELTLNGVVNNLLDKDFTHMSTFGSGRNTEYAGDYFDTTRATTGTVMAGRNYWISMNYQF
ncbi:TonB-dependent receptor [Celerinatantimonas sp. YJH-8]|uniref:TonB-dependent receptor n=1 Tax=Celerinatantimonas sp. YJH-8 TaxID=3228714 RepID=UPI0038CC0CE3